MSHRNHHLAGCAHSHAAHSHDGRNQSTRRLAWTLALTLGYMVAEAIGGWVAGSLALLADAGHMLSDAAALGLSLFAIWIARRPPTPEHSYGYYRAEILAALVNGATLVAIAILIFIEALQRIGAPPLVQGKLMMLVALGGLLVNLTGMAVLHAGRSESLNMRGAWLHLLTDALGSASALLAGGLIWLLGWNWADPAVSIAIAMLVVYSAWGLLQETIAILMQRAPGHLDIDAVHHTLAAAPGVREVHDLHLWTVTSGMLSLSAHVVLDDGHSGSETLEVIRQSLREHFDIGHTTIQIEPPSAERCASAF